MKIQSTRRDRPPLPASVPDRGVLITDEAEGETAEDWQFVAIARDDAFGGIREVLEDPAIDWIALASDAVSPLLPERAQLVVDGLWLCVGGLKKGIALHDAMTGRDLVGENGVLIAGLGVAAQAAAGVRFCAKVAGGEKLAAGAGNASLLLRLAATDAAGKPLGPQFVRMELAREAPAVSLAQRALDMAEAALAADAAPGSLRVADVSVVPARRGGADGGEAPR